MPHLNITISYEKRFKMHRHRDLKRKNCKLRDRAEMTSEAYPYYWSWGNPEKYPVLGLRKDHRCKVLVRGRMNSALIEFEDGYRVVCSRSGIRKVKNNG